VIHQCIDIVLKESIDEKLARDLRELFNGHQRQNEEIAELRRRSDRPAGKSLTRMPANCHDLKTMGHALSGIYPVKGDDNIDMVYCNMTSGEILICNKRWEKKKLTLKCFKSRCPSRNLDRKGGRSVIFGLFLRPKEITVLLGRKRKCAIYPTF
jgi:hypothetical protein